MNRGLSYRASRKLTALGEKIAEESTEYLPEESHTTAEGIAEELAHNDDLLRDIVEAETLLDRQANARRKSTPDVWGDELLSELRESRQEANSVIDDRVSELVEETIEATETVDRATPEGDGDGDGEGVAA